MYIYLVAIPSSPNMRNILFFFTMAVQVVWLVKWWKGRSHTYRGSSTASSHQLSAQPLHAVSLFRPQLVSLDLSWSGFQGQRALVDALVTLPCLRTLVLEGNPLTFTPSYPGFILDSLPRLLYLDATRVTPDDHHRFEGLAKMRG